MLELLKRTECLSNTVIEELVKDAVECYVKAAGKRADNTLKLSLTLEEILLKFKDTYGCETPCTIRAVSKSGEVFYEIRQKGPQMDCLKVDDDCQASYDILSRMGVNAEYTYNARSFQNIVTYSYKKKPVKNKMLKQIFLSAVLSVVFTYLIKFLPDGGKTISDVLLLALFPKLCSILAALATPLVFLSVVTGITGLGDVRSFGKIGKKIFSNMMITYLFAALLVGIMGILVYPVSSLSASAEADNTLVLLSKLILDIVPGNLIDPFLQDNDLQVITLSVFFGVCMLLLGSKAQKINDFLIELSEVIYKMIGFVCKLIPAIVFLGIMNICSFADLSKLSSMAYMSGIFVGGGLILSIYKTIYVSKKVKVPVSKLFKKMLPTLLINITTSSQVTALPENMKCCKEKFGINEKMVDFGVPFGIVTFMPVGAILLSIAAWGIAFIYGIPITSVMIVKIMVIGVLVAIAAPPIPGSGFIVMPIVLGSCSIPIECLPLGMIFAGMAGYFAPAFNGYLLQLEMLGTAKSLDLVDDVKLNAEEKF